MKLWKCNGNRIKFAPTVDTTNDLDAPAEQYASTLGWIPLFNTAPPHMISIRLIKECKAAIQNPRRALKKQPSTSYLVEYPTFV